MKSYGCELRNNLHYWEYSESEDFEKYDKRGNPVYIYHTVIPKTYVHEYEEKLFWNRLYIPDGEALSEKKKIDNWLNYKRECELGHYAGWKTSRYCKWEPKVFHKQKCVRLKIEMTEIIQEYFERVSRLQARRALTPRTIILTIV